MCDKVRFVGIRAYRTPPICLLFFIFLYVLFQNIIISERNEQMTYFFMIVVENLRDY